MALVSDNVRVAVTGAVFKGPTTATAPTGTSGAPAGMTDLGYISDAGVVIAMPGPGDSTPIRAWQNGTTVRVIRTATEDNPTWTFTMIESKIETVETYFGVTVTPGATEGTFEFSTADERPYNSYVVDAIDGADLLRDYIPKGIVTSVADHTLANGETIGYEVTVEGELDGTLGYNFKRWSTALKTVV